MQKQIKEMQRELASLRNAAQVAPDVKRALSLVILKTSTDVVTDYDMAVNESGSATYTVPAIYNGLFEVNGKLIGYYDPV